MKDLNFDELGIKLKNSFPNADISLPIKKLGEGYASEVVETSNGIVFKIAKNHVAQETYKKEHAVLLFLSTKIKDFEIPYPEYYIESSADFTYGLIGYRKLEGNILRLEEIKGVTLEKVALKIARFLYHLHSTDISSSILKDLKLDPIPPSLEEVKQTWLNVSDWLKDNLNQEEYIKVRDYWKEAEAFWENDTQPDVLAHGDIWFENFIVDKENSIVGIIDFGSAKIGDKAIDFAVQNHISNEFRDEVMKQYVNLGGDLGTEIQKRMDYLLALREIYGLEYGMMTNDIDVDTLNKIKHTILKSQ